MTWWGKDSRLCENTRRIVNADWCGASLLLFIPSLRPNALAQDRQLYLSVSGVIVHTAIRPLFAQQQLQSILALSTAARSKRSTAPRSRAMQ